MRVGSFFFVPGITRERIYGHVWQVGKQLGMTFSCRLCYMKQDPAGDWQPCKETDVGATLGVGVWRTA
jgi:hypothetical protein